jgi:hypothetical protein
MTIAQMARITTLRTVFGAVIVLDKLFLDFTADRLYWWDLSNQSVMPQRTILFAR